MKASRTGHGFTSRATALVLSWAVTATSVWGVAPPLVASRSSAPRAASSSGSATRAPDALRSTATAAVAILGTTLSTEQCALLARAPAILLMLDGDDAGRQATRIVRDQLAAAGLHVITTALPDNTDPDQLADPELRAAWDCFSGLRQKP